MSLNDEWHDFKTDVDNVIDLSENLNGKIRVLTQVKLVSL